MQKNKKNKENRSNKALLLFIASKINLPDSILYKVYCVKKIPRPANLSEFFKAHMADNITGEIRAARQTGTPLMNNRFKEQIEKVFNLKVEYAKKG